MTKLNSIKLMISTMMNEENDAYADLINKIKGRIGSDAKVMRDLKIAHEAKMKVLSDIWQELQII